MEHFDSEYGEQLLRRIRAIPEAALSLENGWDKRALVEHLVWMLRHALGRSLAAPDCSAWWTRRIWKPLVLRGWLKYPASASLAPKLGGLGLDLREPGDLETLQALIEEYLNLVQADELEPVPHPVFGKLTVDEWDRLHVLHFERHLRQFAR